MGGFEADRLGEIAPELVGGIVVVDAAPPSAAATPTSSRSPASSATATARCPGTTSRDHPRSGLTDVQGSQQHDAILTRSPDRIRSRSPGVLDLNTIDLRPKVAS